jgi:hypothetical protein
MFEFIVVAFAALVALVCILTVGMFLVKVVVLTIFWAVVWIVAGLPGLLAVGLLVLLVKSIK